MWSFSPGGTGGIILNQCDDTVLLQARDLNLDCQSEPAAPYFKSLGWQQGGVSLMLS